MDDEKKIVIKTIRLKSGLFSSFMVLLCVTLAVLYTVKVLDLVEQGYQEPSVLTGAVFGAIFGELWNLMKIYQAKKQGGNS